MSKIERPDDWRRAKRSRRAGRQVRTWKAQARGAGGARKRWFDLSGIAIFNLALIAFAATWLAPDVMRYWSAPTTQAPVALLARRDTLSADFGLCHTGGGVNCVVDGDTFWFAHEKYRIADIDTPETHPARCPSEAALGARATQRLQALMNAGAFTLESAGRDTDRYGRKLRVVTRGGQSIGGMLVSEGLAREWTGRREPWC